MGFYLHAYFAIYLLLNFNNRKFDILLFCYNLFAGLANKKTVSIQPAGKEGVLLATTKTKKQAKPASLLHKSLLKKEFNRMAKVVVNQVT